MIRTLFGVIITENTGSIVLDVNGVGYLIYTTETFTAPHTQVRIWTHLAVRENSLDLYGFLQQSDCALFEELLKIPKIGPRSALQILSKIDSQLLLSCVVAQDAVQLQKRSGIGKKTAEKLVQELQNSHLLEMYDTLNEKDAVDDEVVATLIALGYPERTAYETVRIILQEQESDISTQSLIRVALQKLST